MISYTSKRCFLSCFFCCLMLNTFTFSQTGNYVIVDTEQSYCYNNQTQISFPNPGSSFYGQDAQFDGVQPSYQNNSDGTVTDLNTGLMWQKTPDIVNKSTYSEALAGAATLNLAGFNDWRLPTIKELYSLIDFNGETRMSALASKPYIDTDYFDFVYGDESAGERFIDAQYVSSNLYVGTTMNGEVTVFGVNFADGRIKGYGIGVRNGYEKEFFVRYVRGNSNYGINNFVDKDDGTITDLATGLMWQKSDDGTTRNWQEALSYAENLELAGYDDWRLPNAKELQSIVDYDQAPDATDPAKQGPAIDSIFELSETESWFWTSTTHLDGPDESYACYICFGQAFGFMETPPGSGTYQKMNVHGAGAQRSDPKSGNPANYPFGHGPQGDEVRIANYVRCVRDASSTGVENNTKSSTIPETFSLGPNYPNPFNPVTTIRFDLPESVKIELAIYNALGRKIDVLLNEKLPAGEHNIEWYANSNPCGVYFCKMETNKFMKVQKMMLLE